MAASREIPGLGAPLLTMITWALIAVVSYLEWTDGAPTRPAPPQPVCESTSERTVADLTTWAALDCRVPSPVSLRTPDAGSNRTALDRCSEPGIGHIPLGDGRWGRGRDTARARTFGEDGAPR
ncbi:MAG: hypothetical protein ACE5FA_13330 [Dehalococcoidia bacterium]